MYSYLSVSYPRPLETLIDCLLYLGTDHREERGGTVEMIVAALQKLSLRWTIRKKMIQRGIVEWLIDYISCSSTGWSNRISRIRSIASFHARQDLKETEF